MTCAAGKAEIHAFVDEECAMSLLDHPVVVDHLAGGLVHARRQRVPAEVAARVLALTQVENFS